VRPFTPAPVAPRTKIIAAVCVNYSELAELALRRRDFGLVFRFPATRTIPIGINKLGLREWWNHLQIKRIVHQTYI
jgi:hypothetical protein